MDDGDIPGEERGEIRRQDLKIENNSEAQTKNLASLLILFFRFAYRKTVIRIKADVDIGSPHQRQTPGAGTGQSAVYI